MIVTARRVLESALTSSTSLGKSAEWSYNASRQARGRINFTASLLCTDLAAVALVLVFAVPLSAFHNELHWPSAETLIRATPLRSSLGIFILSAIGALCYLARRSHYSQRTPLWMELRHLVIAGILAALCASFLVSQSEAPGAHAMYAKAWLLFPAFAVVLRRLLRHGLMAAGLWQIRTVIVGERAATLQTLTALQSEPALGYSVVAIVSPQRLSEFQAYGRWRGLLDQNRATLVILVCDADNMPDRTIVNSLVRERVSFAVIPQLDGLPVHGFEQTRFFSHDTVMFSYRNNLAQPTARLAKVVFDCVAASLGILFLAPVILLIAIAVKLDGGPVFFGHLRVGAGGRPFRCLKFRSMVVDSDGVLRRLLASDPAIAKEWAETQKLKHDPRITTVGRFLRATSLDELPQLFNVLRLQMSLVGPRPIVQAEVVRYGDDIAYYYETRPGLTGLWQVSGRASTSYDYRVHLDTWYVKNWTIWHDVTILAKTLPAVIARRGAF
jgi:Undecaprenyl-phosphate galactose phosphotransferase WbaP